MIRAELQEQRSFRIQQLHDLAADATDAVAAADGPRLHVTWALTAAAESALGEIEAALQRLEDGSFGMCERCGEPIPAQRLQVLPMSRLCSPCQAFVDSGPCEPW